MAVKQKQDYFTRFTTKTSEVLGRPWVFVLSLASILIWATTGPILGFSDSWQLVVNTTTTIITFLMVFVIQNTQNRNDMAVNIKLDRLLEEHGIDSEKIIAAEDRSDRKLEKDREKEKKRAKNNKHTPFDHS